MAGDLPIQKQSKMEKQEESKIYRGFVIILCTFFILTLAKLIYYFITYLNK
jgi:hypothetical protein